MRRMAKYIWRDYRTNQYDLLKFKIRPLVQKIITYRKKLVRHVRRMDRDRQTGTLKYEYQPVGNKANDDPSEDISIGNGTRTGHET
jgi:hypothetical protein